MAGKASQPPGGLDPDVLPCVILVKEYRTVQGAHYEEGSLYGITPTSPQTSDFLRAVSLDNPEVEVPLPGSHVQRIDTESRELLRNIKQLKRRLDVFKDPEWLAEGKSLEVGDQVLIYHKKPPLTNESGGILRYKGQMIGRKGVYFGIELDPELAGCGTSDGTFRKVKYFDCHDDCAIFETIYHVRLNTMTGLPSNAKDSFNIQFPPSEVRHHHQDESNNFNSIENMIDEAVRATEGSLPPLPLPPQLQLQLPPPNPQLQPRPPPQPQPPPQQLPLPPPPQNQPVRQNTYTQRASSGSTSLTMSMNLQGPEEGAVGGRPDVPLSVNERVVWVSDTGIHRGWVRWIGLPGELDEEESHITAGVELDEPVGTGTGRYKGRDLFHVRKNHAAIMPIMGLIKEADFDNPSTAASAASSRRQNSEDEDLKRAIAESLKDQQRRSSSSSGHLGATGHVASGSGSITSTEHVAAGGPITSNRHVASSGDINSLGQINSSSSFPTIKVPPVHPDQPESYMGEGVRRKKPSAKAPPPQQTESSSGVASMKPEENPHNFNLGSRVEILKGKYGVIKWIGKSSSAPDPNAWMVGILMDKAQHNICTAGTFLGVQYFDCPPHRGFFGYLKNCKPDTRQLPANPLSKDARLTKASSYASSSSHGPSSLSGFESIVSTPETVNNMSQYTGRTKGIAGLEGLSGFISLLYAWFQFSNALDYMLCRETTADDVECFRRMRELLRNSILKPLRVSGKVHAETVKEVYDTLSTFAQRNRNGDLTKAFPEDYISLIVNKIFCSQLVQMSSGSGADYLMISPASASLQDIHFPSTRKLLQAELVQKRMKFASVPQALHIICKFERIHPLLELDLGVMVEGRAHYCSSCHRERATVQCFDCFSALDDDGLTKTYFCGPCSNKKHSETSYMSHGTVQLPFAEESQNSCTLHLSAVICYDQNRFVTVAKCHRGTDSPWVKFDCMAGSIVDKEEGKRFISDVSIAEQLAPWLTPPRTSELAAMKRVDMTRDLQLLCLHAHMCIYVKEQ